MRHAGDIFEQESYRGTGLRTMSGVALARLICSVLSGLAAFYIVANFGALTARIAILLAELASGGIPLLVATAVLIYFIVRLKWKLRRMFWGW